MPRPDFVAAPRQQAFGVYFGNDQLTQPLNNYKREKKERGSLYLFDPVFDVKW
jgi:hypothetical protein